MNSRTTLIWTPCCNTVKMCRLSSEEWQRYKNKSIRSTRQVVYMAVLENVLHANLTCNNLISVYMHSVCLIVCIFVLNTQIKHTHLIDI